MSIPNPARIVVQPTDSQEFGSEGPRPFLAGETLDEAYDVALSTSQLAANFAVEAPQALNTIASVAADFASCYCHTTGVGMAVYMDTATDGQGGGSSWFNCLAVLVSPGVLSVVQAFRCPSVFHRTRFTNITAGIIAVVNVSSKLHQL